MRKIFEFTEEQLAEVLKARRPTAAMYLDRILHGAEIYKGPNQSEASVLTRLGKELGFIPGTMRPNRKGKRFFSAETDQEKVK